MMNIRDNHHFAKADGPYSLPRRFTMAEPTETPPRGPTNLRIKFRSASVDQFIERYAVDVSRGGIFIRTREPLAVGTRLKLEFQLQDAAPLLAGEGTVVWIREPDPMRGNATPGMGVRFDKLTPESQPTLEKILAEKTRLQQTGASQPAGPPAGLTKTSGGMAVRRSGVFQALDPSALKPAATSPTGEASAAPADAARPALGVTAKTSLPAAAGPPPIVPATPAGAPMGPFRARTTTGAGLRPAPVPSALFEPPTADDIDKALEALHETSGPVPAPAGGGGLVSGAAAPRFVADDLSNEPTRVADVLDELLVGGSTANAAAAPEAPLETVDTGAVVAMEDAPSSGGSSGAASAALDAPIGDELPDVEPAQPLPPEPRVESAGPIPVIGGVPHRVPPEKSTRFRAASSAYPILQRRRGLGIAIVLVVGAAGVVAFGVLKLHWKDRFFPKSSTPIAAPVAEAPPPVASAPQVDAAPAAMAAAAEGAGGAPAKADDGTAAKPAATAPAPADVAGGEKPAADGKPGTSPTAPGGAEHGAPKHPIARHRPRAAADDTTAGGPAAPGNQAADGAKAAGENAGGDKPTADKGAAAPAAEAAAPPAPVLKITSTPSGAEVLIDGTSVGNTPFISKTLDPSAPHAITVKKDGYEANERMIGGLDWSQPHGNSPSSLKVNVKLHRTAPAPSAAPAAPKENAEPAEDTGGPYIKEIKPDSP
jgi:uncharacterized protein (TIGR02266 family)